MTDMGPCAGLLRPWSPPRRGGWPGGWEVAVVRGEEVLAIYMETSPGAASWLYFSPQVRHRTVGVACNSARLCLLHNRRSGVSLLLLLCTR
jgi:hypothetical protein